MGTPIGNGGARRDRTADLLHAMQALSQLSYGPHERAATLRKRWEAVNRDSRTLKMIARLKPDPPRTTRR